MADMDSKKFIAANDRSLVVSASVRLQGGARYRLKDGSRFILTLAQCRGLPEGYPKWDLPHD